MQEFIAFDAAPHKNKGALAATEVNKTHYIKTPGVGTGTLQPGQGTSTPAAMAYKRWLDDASRNVLKIDEVFPWARRARHPHRQRLAVLSPGKRDRPIPPAREESHAVEDAKDRDPDGRRPMVVSKVFPAGPSILRVHMPIPRIRN
jgi:hypothetical protein